MRAAHPVPDVHIDLGDNWTSWPEPEEPRRHDRRGWLFGLVLVPVLALVGAVPGPPAFREVASVPEADVQVFAAAAASIDVLESSTVDTSTVASYRMDGGARQWSAPVPGSVTDLLPQPAAGVLLAMNVPETPDHAPAAASVTGLDQATGRLLWTRHGVHLVDVPPGGLTAVLSTDVTPPATEVFALDLRTGRPAWTLPLGRPRAAWALMAAEQPGTGGAGNRLLAIVDDTVMVLDEASGAVLATRTAGIPANDARSDDRPPRLYVFGRLGIVAYEDHNRTVYSGYDLASLAPRWRVTMPTETGDLADCGHMLCAGTGLLLTCFPVLCSAIDSFLYGLDPTTASTRWISRRWSRTGAVLAGQSRVLAFNREPPGLTARGAIIDPVSGRTALELGMWAPVSPAPGTALALMALRGDSYHSWLAVLGGHPLRLVLVGRLPVAAEACQSTPTDLVCPTLDGRLTAWRYRVP